MKNSLINSIIVFSWLLLWPHAILYLLSNQRKQIYEDIMADMKYRSANITGISAVLYVLLMDRYYRSLFYYRIGVMSYLVSWLWRGDNSFCITAKNLMGRYFVYTHPLPISTHTPSVVTLLAVRTLP